MTVSTDAGVGLLPSWRPPLLGAALGMALVLTALLGPAWIWVAVVLTQLLLVLSWHRAMAASNALGGMVVGGVLIAAADIAVGIKDDQLMFGPIAVVLGVGYLLAVVQQLVRRDGRPELTASLAATVSLAAIGALGAGWAVLPRLPDGEAVTVVAGTAVAGAAIGRLLPRTWGALIGTLLLGLVAAVFVARGYPRVEASLGWWIGIAASIPTCLAALIQVRLPLRVSGWPASAAWPVLLAAPLVYLVVRFVQ